MIAGGVGPRRKIIRFEESCAEIVGKFDFPVNYAYGLTHLLLIAGSNLARPKLKWVDPNINECYFPVTRERRIEEIRMQIIRFEQSILTEQVLGCFEDADLRPATLQEFITWCNLEEARNFRPGPIAVLGSVSEDQQVAPYFVNYRDDERFIGLYWINACWHEMNFFAAIKNSS